MAALFDTTVGVLLLRRRPPEQTADLIRAARAEIAAGTALLPAPAASELVIGEKDAQGAREVSARLGRVPTVILAAEAAGFAGSMGAFLGMRGAAVPFPDLLIAATAVWLDVPLLAWDADYPRARKVAIGAGSDHPGAELWRRLRLHSASLGT